MNSYINISQFIFIPVLLLAQSYSPVVIRTVFEPKPSHSSQNLFSLSARIIAERNTRNAPFAKRKTSMFFALFRSSAPPLFSSEISRSRSRN
ncbi:hypothetical protein L596_027549 [Steinernema carpocapsae]|uniref:Secreted protein n=1 Tax=Steinernema carpocapsae TaxID=34508 RepID=A0A4U5LVU1_STECR|nr:hypothetical protein L596_027549 [Steinernema carpocapsae]